MTEEKYLDGNSIKTMESVFTSNQNNDLFDEDSHIAHKVLRVKRVSLPQHGENWEVLEDNRVVLTLKGVRLTKREKSILYTIEGIKLLMDEYKSGNKSIAKIKRLLKEIWKFNNDKI